jgi:uncharacterized repeat protein (TIGR01451 family)
MRAKLSIIGACVILLLLPGGLALPAQAEPPRQASDDGDDGPPIQLLARTFVPEPGLAPALQGPSLALGEGRIHVLLQMDHIPSPEERAALAEQGIELQEYVPQQAWIASVPAVEVATLASRPGMRWVGPWSASDKLAPRLQAGDFPAWAVHESGRVGVMVLLHADVSLAEGEALAAAHEGVVAGSIDAPRGLTVWIMPENLPALAAEEGVLWIEESPPPLTAVNDDARRTLGVDTLHAAPYNLDGSGVKLFVFDAGTVDNHIAFSGRLTVIDDVDVADHPTHVAGTAAGDGSGSPGGSLKGMAPAASIYSAEYEQSSGTMLFWDNAGDIQADYATARNSYGVDLATNSIGSNTASNGFPCSREGDYGVSSSMIDGIVRGDNPTVGSPYIVTWANGNERTGGSSRGRCGSNYNTTAPPSCAKNPIHVGATNSDGDSMTRFSSWGPCDDGRLKPVVSGPGCESGRVSGEDYIHSTLPGNTYGGAGWCGTSMATPAVAGVASLAIEQYRDTTGNPSARPSNALMKAWLIHTARDLGNDGPDYIYGYGEVDAVAAIDLIKSPSNYTTDSVSQGSTDAYAYEVPDGASEFKVTLAWDDYAAAAFAANALVNNLNLTVVAPGGSTYYPFSLDPSNPQEPATANGHNTRDNQEQVVVQNPTPGTWTIRVRGASVPQGPQSYALASSHEMGLGACTQAIVNGDFESGTTGWTLSGATRVSSPGAPPFGGSMSLRLGGSTSSDHNAYQTVSIPADIDLSANLSFAWYMTTNEGGTWGHGYDDFFMEVRNTSNVPLAVYELRNDGWLESTWLTGDNIDLTPFAGQTVRVAFYADNDSALSTTFYVDEVELWLCKNVPDLSIVKEVPGGPEFSPGDPISFTLSITNLGAVTATGVVVSDTLSSDILSPSWGVSPSLAGTTERGGAPFVWDLPNLGPGASGTITIYGTLDAALPPEFTIVNVATISASESEASTSNNSSQVVVGLKYSYLPVILKNY